MGGNKGGPAHGSRLGHPGGNMDVGWGCADLWEGAYGGGLHSDMRASVISDLFQDIQYPEQEEWRNRIGAAGNGSGQHQTGGIARDQYHGWGPHVRIGRLTRLNVYHTNPAHQRCGSILPGQFLPLPSRGDEAVRAECTIFSGALWRKEVVYCWMLP